MDASGEEAAAAKPRSTAYSLGPDELSKRNSTSKFTSKEHDNNNNEKEEKFECNICLDSVSYPIVTLCGHLFCWPCIHQWMTSDRSAANSCPVCKSGISTEKCIPIYNNRSKEDPRLQDIPNRPRGHQSERSQPNSNNRYQQPPAAPFDRQGMFGIGGVNGYPQFSFTAGIGFPFFGLNFQFPHGQSQTPAAALTPDQERQQMIAQFFLFFGLLLITYIILL